MKLSTSQRRHWGEYLRYAADILGLRDWTFQLEHDLFDEAPRHGTLSPVAKVEVVDKRKKAYVSLSESFLCHSADEQRHIIAHELVHCHFDDAWKQVRDDLEELIGKPADSVFWESFVRNMEHGIDAVAEPLAKRLELPREPRPQPRKKTTKRAGARKKSPRARTK